MNFSTTVLRLEHTSPINKWAAFNPAPSTTTHLSTGETEMLYVCLVLFIDVVVSHRIPDLLFAVAGRTDSEGLAETG